MTSAFVLGADTNVLVRFVTRDDPVQSPKTLRLFKDPANQPIHVCVVALVELVWVLHKVKRWPMADVLAACSELLNSTAFEFEDRDMVVQAIADTQTADCDLADALIGMANRRAGCDATATFDTSAQRLESMIAVEDRV